MILILSSCAFLYIRALHVKSPRPPAGGGQGCTGHGFRGASRWLCWSVDCSETEGLRDSADHWGPSNTNHDTDECKMIRVLRTVQSMWSYHSLQPGAERGRQTGQQLHVGFGLWLGMEQREGESLTNQHQQLRAQNILVLHLHHHLRDNKKYKEKVKNKK